MDFNGMHNPARQGCPLTESLQHGGVALSAMTESKIRPFDHTFRLKRIHNDSVKELLRRHLQKRLCDREHDHRIRSGSNQQFDSIFDGCQNRRSELRTQHGDRMRIERYGHGLSTLLRSQLPQRVEHHGMTQVNSVKVPDGHAAMQLGCGDGCGKCVHESWYVKRLMNSGPTGRRYVSLGHRPRQETKSSG